jgi:transcriptional regulator with XRE-family HTH domain
MGVVVASRGGIPDEGLPHSVDRHPDRIRQMRLKRGMSVEELARETGRTGTREPISASYIYLIESGKKIPEEDNALKLARALGDDERLYKEWVNANKAEKQQDALEAAARYEALAKGANVEVKVADTDHIVFGSLPRPGEFRKTPSGSRLRRDVEEERYLPPVPVYAEGTDPAAAGAEELSTVNLKCGVLPLNERIADPFAYRLSPDGVARVRGTLQEGDTVIITRDPGPIVAEEIYAVRHEGTIVLSRVLDRGSALLLLSDEGPDKIEMISVPRQGGIRSLLVGRVVAAIRPYHYAVVSPKK